MTKLFKAILPKTKEELKKYYQFRYDIMCEELNHIKKNDEHVDTDEYDDFSHHIMILNSKDEVVGTTRIIYNSPFGYPTPKYMEINKTKKEFIPQKYSCEISRVFVNKNIRSIDNTKEIIHLLSVETYKYAKKHNIKFFYAALEKNFIKLLKILKINFTIIGKQGEFYGLRYPCIISDEELFKHNPYIN